MSLSWVVPCVSPAVSEVTYVHNPSIIYPQSWERWAETALSSAGPRRSLITSTPACMRRETAVMWSVYQCVFGAVSHSRLHPDIHCHIFVVLVFPLQDMYYVSVKALYTVGYSTSLVSLTMAMVILCRFRWDEKRMGWIFFCWRLTDPTNPNPQVNGVHLPDHIGLKKWSEFRAGVWGESDSGSKWSPSADGSAHILCSERKWSHVGPLCSTNSLTTVPK